MKRARRLSQRLVRWTSLCVCFALVLTSFILFPSQASIGKNTRSGKPSANSGAQGNGQERRVAAPTPQAGPPKAGLPNLDDLRRAADDSRRHGPREVHAPAPIPSRQRRWRHGSERASLGSKPVETKANHVRSIRSLSRLAAYMPQGPDGFAMARIDPHNRSGTGGVDLLSNNFNWSLGLVGLKGRGLDLGLSLSYNSLVWTRSGNYIKYDLDDSTIAPGFRLDFPVIEGPYFNDQAFTNFYLMVTPSGARVELRYTGTANTYESQDSAHLQLQVIDSTHILVRPTDGTRMSFTLSNGLWRCNEIKDRNGNYLTITHNNAGDLSSVTDTLGRVVSVTYDGNGNIQTIDQTWNGQTHHWATFGWDVANIGHNFSGLINSGPDNTSIPVLAWVGLPDGSYYHFEYNNGYGQVTTIRYYGGDARPLRYTTLVYSASGSDSPRVAEQHEWADWWNGMFTVPSEAVTYFSHDGDGGCRVTLPDGTVHKEYYGSTWQSGLSTETRSYATVADANANSWKKRTTAQWTQDNTGVSYFTNPRVTETNIYDSEGNRKRTTIDYGCCYVAYSLPYVIVEYAADGNTILRSTWYDYNLSQQYLDRRIIGLVMWVHVVDHLAGWYTAKTTYEYDEGQINPQATNAANHDPNFSTSVGRGNVTSVSRWDVTDISNGNKALTSHVTYDAAGSALTAVDPLTHPTSIAYSPSYAYAYPTTATDADGNSSSVQYNFDTGAVTRADGPPPAGQSQGASQTMTYDSAGRISRVDNLNNGAYVRWDYGSWVVTKSATIQDGAGESHTVTILDGFGRAVATGGDNPGSAGGSWARFYFTDVMGRPSTGTNPEEISAAWVPSGDDAAGWLWSTPNTYDWKGRPLRTYNMDGTYKEASYGGCGCAGGEVVTLTDEVGRQQKVYSDPLGRQWKTEVLQVLNGQTSVYSTTESTFNARDQVTQVRQFQGQDTSGVYQDMTMSYDGYGRLQAKHVPEQNAGVTSYTYNNDDTINSVTDARGATATYSYNNRHLLIGITFAAPSGISVPGAVGFDYDAAGNRRWMTDGSGRVDYAYDQLSRLQSETRQFNGLSGSYPITYDYTLSGQLKTITEPSGSHADYSYDSTGRLLGVAGVGLGASQYSSSMQYRAWGGLKSMAYGNATTLSASYNNRTQITQYFIGGVRPYANGPVQPEGGDFQYYADGQIKFANDSRTDATAYGLHDRAYAYDHAARLKEAYSGYEARDFLNGTNSGIHDGAFRQSYGYDVWGNMTSRTGRFWSEDDISTDAYNSQNRNPAWDYDGDGRLVSHNEPPPDELPYQPLRFTYDASGRRVQSTQTTSRQSPNPNSTVVFTTTTTQIETNDGDGWLVKSARTTQFNSNPPSTATTFFLRSSLLGGVIAEYDSAGTRQNAYVFAGGEILAQQQRMGDGTTRLMWQHMNPLTGDGLNTDSQGVAIDRTTVDPMGVKTGDTDPFASEGGGGSGGDEGMSQSAINSMVAALVPGWGGPTCKIDGMITSCHLAFGALSSGAAVMLNPGANTTPRMVVFHGQSVLAIYRATYDGYQGYIPMNANYTGNGNFAFSGAPFPHGYFNDHARLTDTDFASLNRTGNNEQFLARSPEFLGLSQNPKGLNPSSLQTPSRRPCQIRVNFHGNDFYGLPLGPGVWENPVRGAVRGVGFTVTTTVTTGGIGHIGKSLLNSGGAWTINQSSKGTALLDGKPQAATEPNDIGFKDIHERSGANQYTYWDFPGIYLASFKNRAHGRLDFDITATNGQEKCELKFRIDLDLGGSPQTVNWRRVR